MGTISFMRGKIGPHAVRLSGKFNDHVRHSILDNGITIVTQPRYLDRMVNTAAVVPVGSYQDPWHQEGVAHYLEHMIFPISQKQLFRRKCGNLNAYTSSLAIQVRGSLLKDNDAPTNILSMLKDVYAGHLDPISFEKQKRRIKNEIGVSGDDAQDSHLQMLRHLHAEDRSYTNIMGSKKILDSITIDDLEAYKNRYFYGSNIYIGMTGINHHDQFVDQASSFLSGIPRGKREESRIPTYVAKEVRNDPGHLNQTYFGLHFPVPVSTIESEHTEGTFCILLENMIDRKIIDEEALVYGTDLKCEAQIGHPGLISLIFNTLPEDAGKTLYAVLDVIDRIIQGDIDEEADSLLNSFYDNLNERKRIFPIVPHEAHNLAFSFARKGAVETGEVVDKKTKAILKKDVHDYALQVFSGKPSLTVYGDGKTIPELPQIEDFLTRRLGHLKKPSNLPQSLDL